MRNGFVSGVVGAIAAVVLISGCSAYDFRSSALLGGLEVEAALAQSHPFLAEYKRYVIVGENRRVYMGIDPGSHRPINVFETESGLTFQTDWTEVLVVDKATQDAVLETRPLTVAEKSNFVGKFQFVADDRYEFVSKEARGKGQLVSSERGILVG